MFGLNPQQMESYGQIALGIGTTLVISLFVYTLVNRSLNFLHRQNYISVALLGIFKVIARWITLILVGLLVLQQVGVPLTSIWAALSATIVLFGVGLIAVWSVASNIFCSLLLLTFRPFNIGDKIELVEPTGGSALGGKVVNLNLLYTYLLEEGSNGSGGNILQMPNNIFFQKTIRRQRGIETRRLENFIFKDDAKSIKENMAL